MPFYVNYRGLLDQQTCASYAPGGTPPGTGSATELELQRVQGNTPAQRMLLLPELAAIRLHPESINRGRDLEWSMMHESYNTLLLLEYPQQGTSRGACCVDTVYENTN